MAMLFRERSWTLPRSAPWEALPGALVRTVLVQGSQLHRTRNALRVVPAETWLTVYRRLHITELTKEFELTNSVAQWPP